MTWYANQVYARPAVDVVRAFVEQPSLRDRLFLVTDLLGVRCSYSRELLLSDNPPDDCRHMRHGLPEDGLLVVCPEIYKTGYDRDEPWDADFDHHYRDARSWPDSPPAAKWCGISVPTNVDAFFPAQFDGIYSSGLAHFLKSVYLRTNSPLVYYRCQTWGGMTEQETAWIFDAEDLVYERRDDETLVEHRPEGARVIQGNLLQLAMRRVGVELPTRYFALHECSFHWRLYHFHVPEARQRL